MPRLVSLARYTLAVLLFISLAVLAFARIEVSRAAGNFEVTTAADSVDASDNALSLREAIIATNDTPGADTISFNIPAAQARMNGVFTINVGSTGRGALPALTGVVTIDGYTQPGAWANFYNSPVGTSARLLIELNGANAGEGASGLEVTVARSVVRGLVINRFDAAGIVTSGTSEIPYEGVTVEGNFIGTGAAGETAQGNRIGVRVRHSTFHVIGGFAKATRNIISGNIEHGIYGEGADCTYVLNNLIGTNAEGKIAIPNGGAGVLLEANSNRNHIGADDEQTGNIISGNAGYGVVLKGNGNRVESNNVGYTASGDRALGNGAGVYLDGSYNLVGEESPDTPNEPDGDRVNSNSIVHNKGAGIVVAGGEGNRISANFIASNGKLGIDLGGDGVTPNDAGDADAGANAKQNYPALVSETTSQGAITLTGALDSPAGDYTIQIFTNHPCHSSGYGEGATYRGSLKTAGANKTFTLNTHLSSKDTGITALAINNATGDTSEFSPCLVQSPDTTGPKIYGIPRATDNFKPVTSGSTIEFVPYFSETITGVDATDFKLTTTGNIVGAAITSVTRKYNNTFTVTVSVGTGEGTLRLDLIDDDTIRDEAGNSLGGDGADNGNFTSGEVCNVVPHCVPPASGLVAWLAGDGDATDLSGSHNGTFGGQYSGTFAPGKVGFGFDFYERFGYVSIDDAADGSLDLTGDMTLSAWVKPSRIDSEQAIISKRSATDEKISYKLSLYAGYLIFSARDDANLVAFNTQTPLPVNEFSHVAATQQGTNLTLYVNGEAVATLPDFHLARPDTAGRLTIGASVGNGIESPFFGLIDEVQLFARALTQSDLSAIHRAAGGGVCKPARLLPIHDAYVKGATPEAGYGYATRLQVKRTLNPGSGKGRQAYLRFDTSSVTGDITRAVLRLNGRLNRVTPLNQNIPCAAFPVSNSTWTEGGLTWLNKPRPDVPFELARVIVTDDQPRWYDFDITAFINSERAAGRFATGVLLRNMTSGEAGDFYTEFVARDEGGLQPRLILTASTPSP